MCAAASTTREPIESVPGRCGGAPVIAGTRVRTSEIWGWHCAGLRPAQIRDLVRVSKAQVLAAIAFEMGRRAK